MIDNNRVILYNNSIELYSGQSFYGEDVQPATSKSFKYWNRFFARLEHELKVILVKPRSQNIKLVNHHYSEINNELSEDYKDKNIKLRIYANDDGKLCYLIDNSFNLHEFEAVHPQTAKHDMEKVKAVFNDIRDKKNYLPSEIRNTALATVNLMHEVAAAQLNQTKLIEALLPKKPKEEIVPKEKPNYFG